ncbi:tetratricopeptide repeat protein [Sulfuricystis multivorans]|uniref:tetratricopeptide repeat protein n=1 Tax=Sulfuricystis multivorans TaxID=2211108 RepID=UPI000F83B89D|nr:tetratricopeptide repeat protein [Sulfuricystis multivorans]
MSIINQMLRDLDARQASQQERAGLPAGLRTLPPEPRRNKQSWVLLVIGLLIGAVAVSFFIGRTSQPPVTALDRAAAPQTASVPAAMPTAQQELQSALVEPAPPSPPAELKVKPVAASASLQSPSPSPNAKSTPAEKAKMSAAATPSKPTESRKASTDKPTAPPLQPVHSPRAASPPDSGKSFAPSLPPAEPDAPRSARTPTPDGRIDKQPKAAEGQNALAESEYRKGMQAATQGDHGAALPLLRHALEIEPRHTKARQALLAVLANLRQWGEVKQVAQEGLSFEPTRTPWATLLARLQYEHGDGEAALKTLESHAAHAANDADFQALFAFLLQKRQLHDEAAQHYEAALRLRPAEGRWWFGLGLALEAAGRGDEARVAFAKARETGNLPAEMRSSVEEKLRTSSLSASPPP